MKSFEECQAKVAETFEAWLAALDVEYAAVDKARDLMFHRFEEEENKASDLGWHAQSGRQQSMWIAELSPERAAAEGEARTATRERQRRGAEYEAAIAERRFILYATKTKVDPE